ncbi:MAG: GIY-YIG nuclease family protein [Candidatus Gracilibacteria bacterium]|nr:GIY-YIG nuclease family protein [Candidatus Gracilibacteria bacterium]
MKNHNYFVYILASDSGTLYIGATSNLEKRIEEHKQGVFEGFSKKYNCFKLVYMDQTSDITAAIEREKQLKNWNRKKKELLIASMNPTWEDLSQKW